jgi:hypothetical protein
MISVIYVDCRVFETVMQSVIMLGVVMLNVVVPTL